MCWLSRENEVEEVKNEGPKEMTLDEWKAMQDKERTKVEFNIRKPNEGADSQWKKGYVLHKSKSEDVSFWIYGTKKETFAPTKNCFSLNPLQLFTATKTKSGCFLNLSTLTAC